LIPKRSHGPGTQKLLGRNRTGRANDAYSRSHSADGLREPREAFMHSESLLSGLERTSDAAETDEHVTLSLGKVPFTVETLLAPAESS
jgi:hypothetical protein